MEKKYLLKREPKGVFSLLCTMLFNKKSMCQLNSQCGNQKYNLFKCSPGLPLTHYPAEDDLDPPKG